MHETLRKLVASHNAMSEALVAHGEHLHTLTAQMGALGERLMSVEDMQEGLDVRVTRLEKKGGRK